MTHAKFRVSADIRYMDGTLSGLDLIDGYSVKVPEYRRAVSIAAWLDKVHDTNDFIRATGTGDRYNVISRASIVNLP